MLVGESQEEARCASPSGLKKGTGLGRGLVHLVHGHSAPAVSKENSAL